MKHIWQWCCAANNFGRNSGVGACFFFGIEAVREWTMLVLLPAMAHPWLLMMLAIISTLTGLHHRLQRYREHPVAVAEEIQEISPALVSA